MFIFYIPNPTQYLNLTISLLATSEFVFILVQVISEWIFWCGSKQNDHVHICIIMCI